MKKLTSGVVVAALTCCFAASASAYECYGNCDTMGANGVVTASPITGEYHNGDYLYVSTYGGLNGVGSLGLGIDEKNGSLYVSDSFGAWAGDKLQFYFNYVTSDGTGKYTDYAWAALRPTAGSGDIILFSARTTPTGDTVPGFNLPDLADGAILNPVSTPIIPGAPTWSALGGNGDGHTCYEGVGNGCGYTGWIGMEYLFADTGEYSLVFGVTNVGDTAYNSGLAFDGITINNKPITEPTVPEPATWTMLLASLGLVGALRRRNKKAPTA